MRWLALPLLLLLLPAGAQAATLAELVYDRTPLHRSPGGPVQGQLRARLHSEQRIRLLVLDQTEDGQWLRVRLPSRPNNAGAWIAAERAELRTTPYRVEIDRSARRLVVLRDGNPVLRSGVVVGAPDTPTPVGLFALWDRYRPGADSPLHPWVLELTAHSSVLQEFLGGDGRIAMHGMQGGLRVPLGSAASHGCVRLPGRTVRWMARHLSLGTPVRIRR